MDASFKWTQVLSLESKTLASASKVPDACRFLHTRNRNRWSLLLICSSVSTLLRTVLVKNIEDNVCVDVWDYRGRSLPRAKIDSIELTIYSICRQSWLLPASNIDSDCIIVLGRGLPLEMYDTKLIYLASSRANQKDRALNSGELSLVGVCWSSAKSTRIKQPRTVC